MNNTSRICSSEWESEKADKYRLVLLQRHAEKSDKNQALVFTLLAKMYGKLNFYLLPELLRGYESIRKAHVNLEYAKFSLQNVIKNLPGHSYEDILWKVNNCQADVLLWREKEKWWVLIRYLATGYQICAENTNCSVWAESCSASSGQQFSKSKQALHWLWFPKIV